jgi:hypothetical protein
MRRVWTVVVAGCVSGALDIVSAFASYAAQGATVPGILKYIASGVFGAAAMQGGMGMVWAGLFFHFALTTAMAVIFLFAALKVRALVSHPWLWGSVYGVLTWIGMVYIVVPLSAVPAWKLPEGWSIVSGLLAHIFYVGVPIAHIVRFGLGEQGSATLAPLPPRQP